MALSRAEAAAQVAEHIINHSAHGYSQPNRKGDGTTETITLSSGEKVQIHGGDYDCSELVRQCYAAVGVLPKNSYMWTGNERQLLLANSFRQIPVGAASQMQRGDILLRSGHTEIYLGNGKQGGARGSELGTITGRVGDQTGREITSSAYTPSSWTSAFRYAGTQGETKTVDVSKLSLQELVAKTLAGDFGNGDARKKALGSRYDEVQRAINSGSSGASKTSVSSVSVGGTYKCIVDSLNVRTSPSMAGTVTGQFAKGDTVILDNWSTQANGYVWGRYTTYKGNVRYVAVGTSSKPNAYLQKVS